MNKIFNFKKIIILALIIVVLLIPKYTLSKIMDSFSIAENEIVKKIDCPNNKYTAIAFIRDAGATTSNSPQVSILKKGKKFIHLLNFS